MRIRIRIPNHFAHPLRGPLNLSGVRRFFAFVRTVFVRTFAAIALLLVFLLSAFAALRLAIHGREVTVPSLTNLSDSDAASTLQKLGLNLSVENRFYAASIPVNHVLSQSPAAGSRVRRGWQIRVTESLGTQQVPVPDVTGQDQQPATFMLRRLQLDVGAVAHIPAPGPAGVVLAQSPPPNVAGIDGPRVAVLVADDQDAPAAVGYVMPSLIGLTVAQASARLATVGLHIAFATGAEAAPTLPGPASSAAAPPTDPAIPPTIVTATPARATSTITSQSPLPGHRVSRADNIRVLTSDATP